MRSLALAAALTGSVAGSTANAQPTGVNCDADLSLRLRPLETRVTAGSALRFEAELANHGQEPRWVPGNLFWGISLAVYDASGVRVDLAVVYSPPAPPTREDFLKLFPKHSLKVEDHYPARDLGLAPGVYTAVVDFQFQPGAREGASVCSGWLRAENDVEFEVVE